MKFYVASGLVNRDRVRSVVDALAALGHTPAYDWTLHGDVRRCGEERMREVAGKEAQGVVESELVLLMLPGGAGTHTELGLALAARGNKRILLWSATGREFQGNETCVFYHHPAVRRICCPFEELMEALPTL